MTTKIISENEKKLNILNEMEISINAIRSCIDKSDGGYWVFKNYLTDEYYKLKEIMKE